MQLAIGILRHARRLQDHLVHRDIVAARQGLDGLGVDGVGRGADRGLDSGPGLGQVPGGDHDVRDRPAVRRITGRGGLRSPGR